MFKQKCLNRLALLERGLQRLRSLKIGLAKVRTDGFARKEIQPDLGLAESPVLLSNLFSYFVLENLWIPRSLPSA